MDSMKNETPSQLDYYPVSWHSALNTFPSIKAFLTLMPHAGVIKEVKQLLLIKGVIII